MGRLLDVAEQRVARRRTSTQTREHVLAIAHELFYWNGIRAIGVDKIAAEAGVAPTTLYRLFASKDDLIAAYVERADHAYREWFTQATQADGRSARERILALFDDLLVQLQPDNCRGCPFLMTLAEYPDTQVAGHRQAVAMKTWVHERFNELTRQLPNVNDPALLADHLTLIMEGAYASVQALGIDGPARQARILAETILPGEDARPTSGS
ncbi:TetR/AcrR family transcriptional regulator [Actinomadura sp. 6N118]|uniref:TetR/AcrR family transcriptional regulator n=1 Tax=Actinomadura sp. 6N118 TaxID=3375151 RepID=UPI00379C2FFF